MLSINDFSHILIKPFKINIFETELNKTDEKIITYDVEQLQIAADFKSMRIYFKPGKRNKHLNYYKRVEQIAGLDDTGELLFSYTNADNNPNVAIISDNLLQGAEFLLAYDSISQKTYDNFRKLYKTYQNNLKTASSDAVSEVTVNSDVKQQTSALSLKPKIS